MSLNQPLPVRGLLTANSILVNWKSGKNLCRVYPLTLLSEEEGQDILEHNLGVPKQSHRDLTAFAVGLDMDMLTSIIKSKRFCDSSLLPVYPDLIRIVYQCCHGEMLPRALESQVDKRF